MTITIQLTKVEVEMLKELQTKDKRYAREIQAKVTNDIRRDYGCDDSER